eukprot:scaffold17843_cov131-Isochrysis_galbana.AAC.5
MAVVSRYPYLSALPARGSPTHRSKAHWQRVAGLVDIYLLVCGGAVGIVVKHRLPSQLHLCPWGKAEVAHQSQSETPSRRSLLESSPEWAWDVGLRGTGLLCVTPTHTPTGLRCMLHARAHPVLTGPYTSFPGRSEMGLVPTL